MKKVQQAKEFKYICPACGKPNNFYRYYCKECQARCESEEDEGADGVSQYIGFGAEVMPDDNQ